MQEAFFDTPLYRELPSSTPGKPSDEKSTHSSILPQAGVETYRSILASVVNTRQ
jgi:hypothetical protein